MWAGPPLGRGIVMDIANHESGDVVQCRPLFTIDSFGAPTTQGFQCWRDAYASWQEGPGTGQIWTDASFDEATHDLALNQTWFCEEPVSMEAYGLFPRHLADVGAIVLQA